VCQPGMHGRGPPTRVPPDGAAAACDR
jgi:hypothetical protein